ncbi:hypothetical protein HDU85_003116 [Gaertneriomyces sp. JEL0708]|nr:hypothetical protein HDU85_003116 [Gaertneriomyces sp. JEL0708]
MDAPTTTTTTVAAATTTTTMATTGLNRAVNLPARNVGARPALETGSPAVHFALPATTPAGNAVAASASIAAPASRSRNTTPASSPGTATNVQHPSSAITQSASASTPVYISYPFSDDESADDVFSPSTSARNSTYALGGHGGASSSAAGPSSAIASAHPDRRQMRSADDADDSEGYVDLSVLDEAGRSLRSESAVLSAYLYKKGEKRRTWKRRWFVLRPTRLAYYHNEQEYKLLNVINLKDIHAVAPVEMKKREHVFGLVTRERTYYIQAPTDEHMREWLRALTSAHRQILQKTGRGHEREQLQHQRERQGSTNNLGAASSSGSRPDTSQLSSGRHPQINSQASTSQFNQPSSRPVTSNNPAAPSPLRSREENSSRNSHHSSIGTADSFLTVTTTPSSIYSTCANSAASSTTSTVVPYRRGITPVSGDGEAGPSGIGVDDFDSPPISPTRVISRFRDPVADDIHQQSQRELSSSEEELDLPSPSHNDSVLNSPLFTSSRVILQGYLHKKRTQRKNPLHPLPSIHPLTAPQWKKQWFVLRPNVLSVYKNDSEYTVKRLIALENVLDVLEIGAVGKKEGCWKIVLGRGRVREVVIRCADEEECRRWVEAVRDAVEEVRKQQEDRKKENPGH